MTRFIFTPSALQNLPLPCSGKRSYYHDTEIRGLCIALTSTGVKTFYLYKKIKGKPTRVFLGHFPYISIDDARDKAKKILGDIEKGLYRNKKRRKKLPPDCTIYMDWR